MSERDKIDWTFSLWDNMPEDVITQCKLVCRGCAMNTGLNMFDPKYHCGYIKSSQQCDSYELRKLYRSDRSPETV